MSDLQHNPTPAPASLNGHAPAVPSVARPDLDEASTIWISSLGHALCHMAELTFAGVLIAVMAEFHLEPGQATWLGLLGYVFMGLGALPAGLLADLWGPTRVMQLYFVVLAGACLAVVCTPSDPWLLFAALTGVGLATSLYHPAGLAMLSLGVRPEHRGRAMGINGVAGSFGQALGPACGMFASMGVLGWRAAYLLVGVLSVAAAFVLWLANRHAAARARLAVGHGTVAVPLAVAAPRPARPRAAQPLSPLAAVLLLGAMMVGGFNYRALMTVLPAYLGGQAASGGFFKGGVLVFVVIQFSALGQYLGGWLSDRLGSRRVYPLLTCLLVPLAFALSFLEGSVVLAVPVACLLGVCLFGQQPIENSLLAETTTARRRSLTYGAKMALTFGVGALGGPAAGWMWEVYQARGPVFLLIAAGGVVMVGLAVLALWRVAPARPPEPKDLAPAAEPDTHVKTAGEVRVSSDGDEYASRTTR